MSDYVGGRRRTTRHKRGGAVPKQLRDWHAFLSDFYASHPSLTYAEAMKKASHAYHSTKKHLGLGSAHTIAGRRRKSSRRHSSRRVHRRYGGEEGGEDGGMDPHVIAGRRHRRRKLSSRRKSSRGGLRRRVASRRKSTRRHSRKLSRKTTRGRGIVSSLAHTIGDVSGLFGLGPKRRMLSRRKSSRRKSSRKMSTHRRRLSRY